MLVVEDVHKSFGAIKALDGVSLSVEQGTIAGLIGPNGSGKTTLFNIISGFYEKDAGNIRLNGKSIDGLDPFRIARMGLVRTFQVAKAPAKLTILENLLLAAKNQMGEKVLDNFLKPREIFRKEKENLNKALDIAEIIKLKRFKNEYAGNLSGGQKKLLSLGRVLMANPDIFLLDEPTAGVNPVLTLELVDVIVDIRKNLNKTFLIIEHDMNVIWHLCDLVNVLVAGSNLTKGRPEEIQKDERVLEAYLSGSKST
ncbi:MAG: ABC transporter ATP-binding protein [Proteobacteria bacterium]|jgi:ABC-type branched-subunit amino acid transport system ATPase component|nr:ABC transporter ATP-binding protein [Pseudomonadota bacterium]